MLRIPLFELPSNLLFEKYRTIFLNFQFTSIFLLSQVVIVLLFLACQNDTWAFLPIVLSGSVLQRKLFSNYNRSRLMWSPLGQTKSDNINRMVKFAGDFYLVIFSGFHFIQLGFYWKLFINDFLNSFLTSIYKLETISLKKEETWQQ